MYGTGLDIFWNGEKHHTALLDISLRLSLLERVMIDIPE